jgi:DNA-binding response OmpR family regulator
MESHAGRRRCHPLNGLSTGSEAVPDGRPNVLVVTGDAGLRAAAARVLDNAGYTVLTAAHSGHAQLASAAARRIDVLVCELALDEMSGAALRTTLRRRHPDLRAVYFADGGTPARTGVIVRPFTGDDLLTELAAVRSGAISTAS